MTIDEVMTLAESVMATAGDVARGWVPVQHLTEREKVLRAAILELLDAEAEACAAEIEGEWWRRGPECAESIRARIAARKEGAKP